MSPRTLLENVVMAKRGLSEAAKKRVKAGRLLLAGKGCAQVALAVGVARQTVYTWKRLLDEGGIDALRAVPERGRPAQLDEPVLYDDLSLREHVEYISRLHGGEGWDAYARDLCDRLGLGPRVDDLPVRFSRGLRQKTSIVLALVRPFSLLLVDEPFVGLDVPGKAVLLELLAEVHDDGAATLVATHDPAYVDLVDRSIALRDGEVVFDGRAQVDQVLTLVGG